MKSKTGSERCDVKRRSVLKSVGGSMVLLGAGSVPGAAVVPDEHYSSVNFAEIGVAYSVPPSELEEDSSPSSGGRLHIDPLPFYTIDQEKKQLIHPPSREMRQAFSNQNSVVRADSFEQPPIALPLADKQWIPIRMNQIGLPTELMDIEFDSTAPDLRVTARDRDLTVQLGDVERVASPGELSESRGASRAVRARGSDGNRKRIEVTPELLVRNYGELAVREADGDFEVGA